MNLSCLLLLMFVLFVQELLKIHNWATPLHWMTCTFITMNMGTVVWVHPTHTPSCQWKYSQIMPFWLTRDKKYSFLKSETTVYISDSSLRFMPLLATNRLEATQPFLKNQESIPWYCVLYREQIQCNTPVQWSAMFCYKQSWLSDCGCLSLHSCSCGT